jgi:hypothetical protein
LLEVLCFEPPDVSATPVLIARQTKKKNALKSFALRIDNHSVDSIYIDQCDHGLKRKPLLMN